MSTVCYFTIAEECFFYKLLHCNLSYSLIHVTILHRKSFTRFSSNHNFLLPTVHTNYRKKSTCLTSGTKLQIKFANKIANKYSTSYRSQSHPTAEPNTLFRCYWRHSPKVPMPYFLHFQKRYHLAFEHFLELYCNSVRKLCWIYITHLFIAT